MVNDLVFNIATREHFDEFGYARLGCILRPQELDELRQRIDAIMMGEITYESMRFQLDSEDGVYGSTPPESVGHKGATLAYRKIMDLELDPVFLRYMQNQLFRAITQHYVGEEVSIYRAMFMNKPAELGTVLPWHQDVGWGWGVDTDPIVTIWTSLDPSTYANGCMQIVPGSHRHGVINKRHFLPEKEWQNYAPPEKVFDLETEAGEVVLLHNLLLHRSGINNSGNPRRAFSIAYMEGETRMRSTGETFPMIFGKNALKPEICN